ncbi:hypothetical protein IscW_ISCW005448, partial [Ixodes scapularis]
LHLAQVVLLPGLRSDAMSAVRESVPRLLSLRRDGVGSGFRPSIWSYQAFVETLEHFLDDN